MDPMGVPFIGVSPDAARFYPCEPFFLFLCGNTWYFGRLRSQKVTHYIVLLGSLDTITILTTVTKRFLKISGTNSDQAQLPRLTGGRVISKYI